MNEGAVTLMSGIGSVEAILSVDVVVGLNVEKEDVVRFGDK